MTSKEALKTLNKYRNAYYNSFKEEERELANALNVILPEHVKLLETNTPKKVIKETKAHNMDTYDYYKCPCCENPMLYDVWQDVTLHAKDNHCPHCGQRLDWGK